MLWSSDCGGARVTMILLISGTLIIGLITGFVFFNEGDLFHGVAGQVLHGLVSIVCFALVGVAFWRFGWKVGVIDLALIFIASNVGITFYTYVRKRSGL
jgi:uncharacterized membrane protein SpoIIM required for sporulation